MLESDRLTRRERTITVLIKRGLTNAQISERLVIEVGTVKNHVHSILQKLGLRSRTEVAVWVSERKRARQRERERVAPKTYPMAHDDQVSGRKRVFVDCGGKYPNGHPPEADGSKK